MLPLAAIAVGALIGFLGSRQFRRRPRRVIAAPPPPSTGLRGKTLTAPELQRACFSEMVRHVRVDRQGRTQAPSHYLLRVNAADLAVIDDTRSWFVDGLREAMEIAARDNGWEIPGALDIRFEVDPSRRPGVPNALAVDPAGPKRADPTGPPPAARAKASGRGLAVVRSDTGARTPLGAAPITIGRATDRTVVIDDTRVSRSHATIDPARSGWTITDQGSANGTTVNRSPLAARTARALSAGDVIGVGPVELRVEADASAEPQVGTRALDDSDRTRISGEVLPPPRRPRS